MGVLEASRLYKSFTIPSVRRDTMREVVTGFFSRPREEVLEVLRSVSFEVEAGEALAVIGRNGGGKSTLLKILCRIFQPDSGRLTVRGRVTPVLELGIGWNPELDAVDNVLLIGTVMGLSLPESRAATDEILAFAGVERFANLQLKFYSSGMASRLAYAVAFQAVRDVLILDEVFAVGDAEFRARCETRFRKLHAQGHTIVLVSHDSRAIEGFCTRALLLSHGTIVQEGAPRDVMASYLAGINRSDNQDSKSSASTGTG